MKLRDLLNISSTHKTTTMQKGKNLFAIFGSCKIHIDYCFGIDNAQMYVALVVKKINVFEA